MDVKRNINGEAWISKLLADYFDLFIWELIQWKQMFTSGWSLH